MSAESPAAAAQIFADELQLTVSTVTPAVLKIRGGYYPSDRPHVLTFLDGNAVRMTGPARLTLSVDLQYRLVDEARAGSRSAWSVEITAYMYAIRDSEHVEIVSWHWHPGVPRLPTHPHLHLGRAADVHRAEFHRAHLPTGIVSVADVVHSAVVDFGVAPRRQDWRDVLAPTHPDPERRESLAFPRQRFYAPCNTR